MNLGTGIMSHECRILGSTNPLLQTILCLNAQARRWTESTAARHTQSVTSVTSWLRTGPASKTLKKVNTPNWQGGHPRLGQDFTVFVPLVIRCPCVPSDGRVIWLKRENVWQVTVVKTGDKGEEMRKERNIKAIEFYLLTKTCELRNTIKYY